MFLTIAVSYIFVVIDWLLFQVFSCPCSCLILRLILQMYTAKAAAALAALATAENQPFNHLLEALKVCLILRFEGNCITCITCVRLYLIHAMICCLRCFLSFFCWLIQVDGGLTADPVVVKPCTAALGCLTADFFKHLPSTMMV